MTEPQQLSDFSFLCLKVCHGCPVQHFLHSAGFSLPGSPCCTYISSPCLPEEVRFQVSFVIFFFTVHSCLALFALLPQGLFLSLHVSMLWDLMRRHCMTRCEEISVVVPAFLRFVPPKLLLTPMQTEQRNSHPRLTFHLSMHTIYMCAHVFHCSLKLFVRFFFVASLCVFQA